ncbi:hypothetical protein KAR91_59310 [Candidatus Pacearchaeota archaeon]|nr:hypothetical protein [Candidatus Pacearchaeota archaeon]
MNHKTPTVIQVINYPLFGEKTEDIILFDNGEYRDEPVDKPSTGAFTPPEEQAKWQQTLYTKFIVKLGGSEFTRKVELHCTGENREFAIIEHDKSAGNSTITIKIKPEEWKTQLISEIKTVEKNFYLSEEELLIEAHNLLKQEYGWIHFRNQVEIAGCIADGLAFVGSEKQYNVKIIGFEAKTNRDNYSRLYDQLSAYQSICDGVYLVVEDRSPPKDLPFYVGIIHVIDGKAKIQRRATSLKHSIDPEECWKTLLKSICIHAGLKRETPLTTFFDTVENIKRKLIWNQFVIGFHQTYVKEYVPLSDDEKRLLQLFFNEFVEDKNDKELVKYLTLDKF